VLTELVELSTAYLMGWKTIRGCAEWLASIDWSDPSLDPKSASVAGRLELLATEVLEGLRPEAEFWQDAAEFVARETNSLYSKAVFTSEPHIAYSSNDSTNRLPELTVPAVGASQSWSISPLPVSA